MDLAFVVTTQSEVIQKISFMGVLRSSVVTVPIAVVVSPTVSISEPIRKVVMSLDSKYLAGVVTVLAYPAVSTSEWVRPSRVVVRWVVIPSTVSISSCGGVVSVIVPLRIVSLQVLLVPGVGLAIVPSSSHDWVYFCKKLRG